MGKTRAFHLVLAALFCLFTPSLSLVKGKRSLWSLSESNGRKLKDLKLENRRLSSLKSGHILSIPNEHLFSLEEGEDVEFDVPVGEGFETKGCNLKKGNPLVPKVLEEKYADSFTLWTCLTEENEMLTMVVDKEGSGQFSATISGLKTSIYVDSAERGTENYVLYDAKTALKEGTFEEDFEHVVFDAEERFSTARKPRNTQFEAFEFILAPLANDKYSIFHGDTKSSVLQAIIVCFSRVNGVYVNELGVIFKLVENADDGICLSSDQSSACTGLPNDLGVLSRASSTLEALGIPSSTYGIGHVLTTGSGGAAALGCVCTRNKARGTTGLRSPINDPFYIDYVSHEVGHQFAGQHTFRDCQGPFDSNLSPSSAVEPGSGSTIMSYAGICGENNVQRNTDPYFHSYSLEEMREFVESISCGRKVGESSTILPLQTVDSCTVPVGNSFQLKGNVNSNSNSLFSWDRIDTAVEDFGSDSFGKFRSFKPTESTSRFFPNLYFQNFPSEEFDEVSQLPPSQRDMSFRFTERSIYDSDANVDIGESVPFGAFASKDTLVRFRNIQKLEILNIGEEAELPALDEISLTWKVGSGQQGVQVEVLVAENTFQFTSSFDYEEHNKELAWEVLGSETFDVGAVSFSIPSRFVGKKVSIMLRASSESDIEGCFFFDIIKSVVVAAPGSVPVPNPSSSESKKGIFWLAGIALLGVVLIALVSLPLFAVLRKRRKNSSTLSHYDIPATKQMAVARFPGQKKVEEAV